MGLSGKYNFKGIKQHGAGGLKLALASNPSLAWINKMPLAGTLLEFFVNWMANNGLMVMNLGAIIVDGVIDQKLLDRSIEEGLKKVENPNITLTEQQMKDIDDAVIKAADNAFPYVKSK